ncbi:MAG: tRNA uridine-5-carboxymethylaminomethyl(34) synthesis enzyme MnmG [Ruminococcaceae bacterium]|nr:tRNA uridine-5-carboxymethylaminomethyl(34) synthesis enzyme MnmG [Oscillospiraceae bacterium]
MFHVKHSGDFFPRVCSVTTRLGEVWKCEAVVVATGTYLDGAVFVGNVSYSAGPDGSLPASLLSQSLAEIGVSLVRFKTGTPARIQRSSIDFSQLEEQPGEEEILPYSYRTREDAFIGMKQIPCHIVYTNAETHRVIRENITRSAMYSGKIHGTGPRYCPSIEDKLVRFVDKDRHQLFVEPLGENTNEMYLQGFSTSLPTDVQHAMLRTLPGFEHAEIMRYAYAIEYDCADPTQMDASLEFKSIGGLFGAGQFNGTSGYEEAAAQGLVAGINAARKVKGLDPMILSRTESYIGTLIDDLVTKGTNEPYRMMTSRSEYRLLLRQDNADARLTPIGYKAGLVSKKQYEIFLQKQERIATEKTRLESTYVSPESANDFLESIEETALKSGASLADLLRRPAVTYEKLKEIDLQRPNLARIERMTVENDIKYAGYVTRQTAEIARQHKLEEKKLPPDLCYRDINGLRIEAAQKLEKIRPLTVGQASRISGVNPADISVLLIYLGLH